MCNRSSQKEFIFTMARTRHISMALSLIILSQLLFSCGTSPAGPGNDTETQSGETSTEESTTSAEIPDDLPEADYEGKTFTTITFDQLLPDYEAETKTAT